MRGIINTAGMILLIFASTVVFLRWTANEYAYDIEKEYEYALAAASKDATNHLRSDLTRSAKNSNFDGFQRESNDYEINTQAVNKVFFKTFHDNLSRDHTKTEVSNNLVLMIAAFDGVMTWSGKDYLPAEPYLHYHEPSKTLYFFTLGDALTVKRGGTYTTTKLESEASPYEFLTMKELKAKAIMDTISKRINGSAKLNYATKQTGQKPVFNLATYDKVQVGNKQDYNIIGNVLSAPAVIAVYDIAIPGGNKTLRSVNIGGTELGLDVR